MYKIRRRTVRISDKSVNQDLKKRRKDEDVSSTSSNQFVFTVYFIIMRPNYYNLASAKFLKRCCACLGGQVKQSIFNLKFIKKINRRKFSKADVSSVSSSSELKFVSFWLSLFFNCCAASPVPAVVNVTLKSQDGIILGKTQVTYGANLQQVVSCPSVLKKFCEDYMSGNQSGNPSGTSGGETENSRTLGK